MADTALNALPITVSDELESPARRALRRLLKRKGAASIGSTADMMNAWISRAGAG